MPPRNTSSPKSLSDVRMTRRSCSASSIQRMSAVPGAISAANKTSFPMLRSQADVSRNIFIREDSHAFGASLINGLIHRHDVGRVKHSGAKMFGFESRVLVEQCFVSHAGSDLLQDELDRKASIFENGLAQHHVLAFLNVILPFQGHEIRSLACSAF